MPRGVTQKNGDCPVLDHAVTAEASQTLPNLPSRYFLRKAFSRLTGPATSLAGKSWLCEMYRL